MRSRQQIRRLEREPQEETDTWTLAGTRYAGKLYAKYLNYIQSIGSFVPREPLTEREMKFLDDFSVRMARQAKGLSVLSKSFKPF